jgi:hypothetical protein
VNVRSTDDYALAVVSSISNFGVASLSWRAASASSAPMADVPVVLSLIPDIRATPEPMH